MKTPIFHWKQLTNIPDHRLLDARGQLHQAVQLLTAVGISFIDPRDDDSHTALLWDDKTDHFLSQSFGPDNRFQLGLDPRTLSCSVLYNHATLLVLELNGTSLQQIASDLQFFLEDHGLPRQLFTMDRHFELPPYAQRWSSPFDTSDQEAFGLLAAAYSNAHGLIGQMTEQDIRAGEPLTWPHHFDMAVLLTLGGGKSIGIGMSPGDASYNTPYFYVNVWPSPAADQMQDSTLSFGKWHSKGWNGMVLTLDQILQKKAGPDQKLMVETFQREAVLYGESISKAE